MSLFKKKGKDEIVDLTAEQLEDLVEVKRSPVGITLLIVNIVGFIMTMFHLYCAGIKTLDVMQFRSIHIALGLFIIFIIYPFSKKSSRERVPLWDWFLAFLSLVPTLYIATQFKALAARAGMVTTTDLIMGLILIALILIASRRVVGTTLVGIAGFFIIYTMYGKYFPAMIAHRGASISTLVRHMIYSTEGVFGVAIGASASFIFMFCLLGALMTAIGADSVLIDLAVSVFGRQRGGPAKAAVISSALFGTISGSSLANVTSTGTFTIPLMKKVGYSPSFAGAVEATASCGGQIMPPVMGAAAFIIAEFTGQSYLSVCLAAALPAVLYFTGIFTAVHFEACRKGLKGVPKEDLPDAKLILKTKGYLLLPLLAIIVSMCAGISPSMSAFIAVLMTIALSFVKKETAFTPKKLFEAFANGAKGAVSVMIACAIVGFIVGSFTLSGLGVKMATLVTTLAHNKLFLTLLFSAITSIILGMGVPTTANYIMMSMITVPAVTLMGVPVMAAHLFCFYFGIVSDLTPPVAMAALTGAGIAKAPFWPTAFNATRLGVAAYIIPFFFVYNSELLLGVVPFTFMTVIQMIFSIIGISSISCGLFGFFMRNCRAYERLLLIVAGGMMVMPEFVTSIAGIAVVVLICIMQKRRPEEVAAV